MIRLPALVFMLLVPVFAVSGYPSFETIRVRIKRAEARVDISGFDLHITTAKQERVDAFLDGVGRAKIKRAANAQVEMVLPSGSVKSDFLKIKGEFLRVGVEPIPYDLEIHPGSSSGVDVVAYVRLEDYLLGVLPAEMPARWPLEALKAQAIASRSFVLARLEERKGKYFDVDSTVVDQVFKLDHEQSLTPKEREKIRQAVRETARQVLLAPDLKVLKAFYSADCGCQSEDPRFVWGEISSFESVKDPTCNLRKPQTWSVTFNEREVKARLRETLQLPQEANLESIKVGKLTPSGRVANVALEMKVDGKITKVSLNSQEFRRIFGFNRIRSTKFSLKWNDNSLNIIGVGLGHGVGLCQTGARSMAKEGANYQSILKFFYPRAKLKTPKSV